MGGRVKARVQMGKPLRVGKVPALGESQKFEDLDACESGVKPVGSLIQRLRGD